jgi:hypothetical protein
MLRRQRQGLDRGGAPRRFDRSPLGYATIAFRHRPILGCRLFGKARLAGDYGRDRPLRASGT